MGQRYNLSLRPGRKCVLREIDLVIPGMAETEMREKEREREGEREGERQRQRERDKRERERASSDLR